MSSDDRPAGRAGRPRGRVLRLLAAFAAVVLGVGGSALAVVPVGLPPPTGPAPVGTARIDLPAGPGVRRLVVFVWYPAGPGAGAGPAPYRADARLLSRQRFVRTHAERDAPVAPGRYPVVLYAHGWGGFAQDNTALMEDLASRGFVAVAVGVPGGFGAWRAPDGQVLNLDGPLDLSTESAAAVTLAIGARNATARADDLSRALDALAVLDAQGSSGRFGGHLRTDRVGVLGFSFGGAVAAAASRQDARIGAVMNMDGWLFGPAQRDGVAVPYLVFSDDTPLPARTDMDSPNPGRRNWARLMLTDWDLMRRHFALTGGDYLTLRGSRHADFSDESLLSWYPRAPGAIAPARATGILRAYAATFFGHWLRGEPAGILGGTASPFPEIEREHWAAPAGQEGPAQAG